VNKTKLGDNIVKSGP